MDGETVVDCLTRLGIPSAEVAIIFVNNRHAAPETILAESDCTGLFFRGG
ncbi:hypothetical protein DSUL_50280 [Desulfovibrionales bacterium]